MRSRSSLLIMVLLCAVSLASAAPDLLPIGHFDVTGLNGWSEKKFQGQTDYRIVEVDGEKVLRAESRASASGLLFKVDYRAESYPVLTWRWKIDHIIAGGDSRSKSSDDYAARIYVVFPHWFFPRTKTLNYIWANRLPKGSFQLSTYTSNDMMIAVESGPANAGRWVTASRDIIADYRRAFGEDPPPVGMIAIMTDTDNTGETALAWYGNISAVPKQR